MVEDFDLEKLARSREYARNFEVELCQQKCQQRRFE